MSNNRPSLWLSLNTLIAAVEELACFQQTLLELHFPEAEPLIERLRVIRSVLPRLLNMRKQDIPDTAAPVMSTDSQSSQPAPEVSDEMRW